MKLERSSLSGQIVETKAIDVNGVPIGVVRGYIATWKVDSYKGIYGVPDIIHPGAYSASIAEHKSRNNRQVRLKDNHWNTIGGFPIDTVREDHIGLYGEGHINLDTRQGKEAYSLARQGVLVDFSVGHIVVEEKIRDGVRHIYKADLIEGSITDEPKNRSANIIEVKSNRFADLPIYSGKYDGDKTSALERVIETNNSDAFVSGQLIADLIDGKLVVIPEFLQDAAMEIKGTPDQIIIERYFGKAGIKSPYEVKMFYTLDDVKSWTNIEIKEALASTGIFSNGALRALVAKLAETKSVDAKNGLSTLFEKIQATTQFVNSK